AAGVYTVSLTATNASGSDPEVKSSYITVSPTGGITLSVRAYKIKGNRNADLTWGGATSTNVDVFRNGTKVQTTANDNFYTDAIGGKGAGTFTYKVCEPGSTTTCSPEVAVSF